jgi:hypothetical protein
MPITLPDEGLFLHLGAHRTGTGSFQEFLSSNADAFADLGVNLAVANRDGQAPSTLRLRLPDARHFRKGLLEERAALRDEALTEARVNLRARSIISEENIPGSFNAIFADAPYRAARERMAFLASALSRPVRRILFVTRSYETFFPSAYRKRCEFRKIALFSDYAPRFMEATRGWADLVEDIAAAFSPGEILVARYEDRPTHEALLHALLPETAQMRFAPLERRFNVSATDAACRAMQAAFETNPKLSPREIRAIIHAHADDRSGPPIAEFSERDRAALRDRYTRDLDRIAKIPGVTLLGT